MKKTLIISGVILIVLLLLFFVYILFFGTPKSIDDVFTNFNIGGGSSQITDTPTTPIIVPNEPDLLSFGDGPFYKLTSRPVAGMAFTGTTTLRYAELGTGYIYEIDISARVESLISSKTFQRVRFAEFSKTGNRVLFEIDGNQGLQILVGSLIKDNAGDVTLDSILLPERSHNASFTNGGEVSYLLTTSSGTEVHTYDSVAEKDTLDLLLPQQKLHAAWPSFVYTTPAAQLPGYIYDISSGSMRYVREGGMGLTAHAYTSGVLVTVPNDAAEGLVTYAIQDGYEHVLPFEVFPEKCVETGLATTTLVCGVDTETLTENTFPDAWYKGIVSFSDTFYSIPVSGIGLQNLFNFEDYPRDFDVLRIETNATGKLFLFIDKNDNSLWLFERPSN